MEETLVTVEQEVKEHSDLHFEEEFEPLKTIPPVRDSASAIVAKTG
jgi:hypothetical protein